jgi:YidC/Oxa1 family membrane protein insertase
MLLQLIDPNEKKPFDFRLLIAFVVMFAIVIVYQSYFAPKPTPIPPADETETAGPADSAEQEIPLPDTTAPERLLTADTTVHEPPETTLVADTIQVETPLYIAKFTTVGADLVSFELKDYHYITDHETDIPIQMRPARTESALRFEFWGEPLKLWRRPFAASRKNISLDRENDTETLVFTWQVNEYSSITKTYKFFGDKYSFDVTLNIPPDCPLKPEREYSFGWDAGLEPTERDMKGDIGEMAAVARLGSDIEQIKKIDDDETPRKIGGRVHWAGVRTKYFANVIIPNEVEPETFIADRDFGTLPDEQEERRVPYFSSRMAVPIGSGRAINHTYTVYMGPLDYFVLDDYGLNLEGMIHLGWKYIVRPPAIAVVWVFEKMYQAIPNYGAVIILFSLLFKIVFHPLTRKSMESMGRMREMQPKMQKIRDKYKNDPQRMNRETMKLYKEAGFNPLSGCLPILFQMPIFFALFQVLRSTIQLRGAEFFLHITDLSQKDPYYILPVVMTVSFFFQQKMTITDPKQKMLVYIMPLVFGFIFAQYAAGLTLYWTCYNLFSLAEQFMLKAAKKKDAAPAST